MKVLVTGPDGLLGSNLIRELLKRNYEVVAMTQSKVISKTILELPIEYKTCDLLDVDTLKTISKDIDVFIHCAASTSMFPARSEIVNQVNIKGTQHVIEACIQNNIKKLIVVGTANSFGPGSKKNPGDENRPYEGATFGLDYMDSKYKAMLLVKDAVEKKSLNAILVHPTFMIGPFDSRPSSGEMILGVYYGKIPGYTNGGKNFVAVKDVAQGIANAITKGRKGESYILGGENLTYQEAFVKMAKVLGVKPPRFRISSFVVISIGWLNSMVAKLFGNKPGLTYELAKLAAGNHYYSSLKAKEELDFSPSSIELAIEECKEWFEKNGLLK